MGLLFEKMEICWSSLNSAGSDHREISIATLNA